MTAALTRTHARTRRCVAAIVLMLGMAVFLGCGKVAATHTDAAMPADAAALADADASTTCTWEQGTWDGCIWGP
jgi:hypothetical protein